MNGGRWDGNIPLTEDEKMEGWSAENWLLENDMYWLAKTITNEAGGSDIEREERIAVGWTVLNRFGIPWKFEDSIQEVALMGYTEHWCVPHKEPTDSSIVGRARNT